MGYVACCVTSKLCGIGPAKRSCGGVKQIKDGKRLHLSGKSTEKRSVLYISSKMEHARIYRKSMEQIDTAGQNAMFGDDDLTFDLQLEKFGVDVGVGALKEVQVKRIFRAWVEDWEEEARKKNDPVSEAHLLHKYKNLVFSDPDTGNTFSIWEHNMEFRQGRGNGWFVLGVCADSNKDVDNNDILEAFSLEIANELIADTMQDVRVQVIRQQWQEEEGEGGE